MKRLGHDAEMQSSGNVVDFSDCLNPIGMPVQVVRAMKVAAANFSSYPDHACGNLVEKLANIEEADADRVVVCAGATDAFTRIVTAFQPHKALVCTPCYAGFERALGLTHTRVVHHSLVAREDFDLTERFVDYIEPDIDMLFLCSPNNPTGRVVPRELLCKVLRAADRWGTWVVVDESFLAFADEHSAVSLTDRYPRLIVVKTFSKTYAMAGLRIGWCVCGTADAAQQLRNAAMPWIVSAPALVGADAALDAAGYLELSREFVAAERERIESGLRDMGMFVIPSQANFTLFQSPKDLREPLLARGAKLKNCGDFRGLDDSWYRVAVRIEKDNRRLLAAIREIIES